MEIINHNLKNVFKLLIILTFFNLFRKRKGAVFVYRKESVPNDIFTKTKRKEEEKQHQKQLLWLSTKTF